MTTFFVAAALLQIAQTDLPEGASIPVYELMKSTNFAHKLTPSKIAYSLNVTIGKRHQIVYVNTKGIDFSGEKIVQIYSTIWAGDAAPSEEIMKKVLPETKKLGAYYFAKFPDGKWALRFNVKFRVTDIKPGAINALDTENLKDTILFTATVGDEMETKVSPDDRY
jgi:hypothetical protein